MEQLIAALKDNWKDYEEMKRDFATCPKWDNDLDDVDEINALAVHKLIATHMKHHEWGGRHFLPLPQTDSNFSQSGSPSEWQRARVTLSCPDSVSPCLRNNKTKEGERLHSFYIST